MESWECGHTACRHHGETAHRRFGLVPPSGAAPTRQFQQRADRNHSIGKSLFPRRGNAPYRGFVATRALHPDQPHWYLFFIGVDPVFQGRSGGPKRIAPVVRIADREWTLCYPETPLAHFLGRRNSKVTSASASMGLPPRVNGSTRTSAAARRASASSS